MTSTSVAARGFASMRSGGRRLARQVGGSRTARGAARLGLVARAGFYVLLAGLVVRVAWDGTSQGSQTNAHGALSAIAGSLLGMVAIAAAAVGFLLLGAVRVAGAVRDRTAETRSRVLTAVQGVFYLALTWVPTSFLFGSHRAGSEQAQRSEAASVLAWPAGPVLVIAVGVVVIGVCAFQVASALRRDFTEGLDLAGCGAQMRRLLVAVGTVGIAARALVFLPIGGFLIAAALQSDAKHANGLDAELAIVAQQSWWGPALLAVVAVGLLVFAAYSLVEARFRRVAHSE